MASLGVNVPLDGSANPVELAADGAKWVRIEAKPSEDLTSWIELAHSQGIEVLLLLTTVSMRSSWSWRDTVSYWKGFYSDHLVDAWQVLNEPDAGWSPDTQLDAAERDASGQYPSSWCMDPDEVMEHLRVARSVLGNQAYIVGPGLSSGHPEYADLVDWSDVDAVSCHPYAKSPGTPELDSMIAAYYDVLGAPLWVSEYDSRTPGIHQALANDPRIEVAIAFCLSDSMVFDFGMVDLDGRPKPSLAEFTAAAGGPITLPDPGFEFVLGFAKIHDTHPDIVGIAIENERGFVTGVSFQRTANGILFWAEIPGGMGFVSNYGTRYRWEQDHLVRV